MDESHGVGKRSLSTPCGGPRCGTTGRWNRNDSSMEVPTKSSSCFARGAKARAAFKWTSGTRSFTPCAMARSFTARGSRIQRKPSGPQGSRIAEDFCFARKAEVLLSRESRSHVNLIIKPPLLCPGARCFYLRTALARGETYMGKRLAIVIGLAAAGVVALGPSTAAATFPGKNGPIAFTALHDLGGQCPDGYYYLQGGADEGIFTMAPNGSAASQVSSQHRPLVCYSGSVFPDPDYRFDNEPSYSPSGKRFVFTLATYADDCNNCDYGDLRLYPSVAVMNVDGTNRQLLREGSDPEFSPSGKKIVFGDGPRIAVMSSRGRHERILTGHGPRGWREDGYEPSFFPSGARVVYVSRKKVGGRWGVSIATIRLDRSHRRRLTTLTK